jgi:hypothetical protein
LCFRFGLIYSSASSFLTCECGHGLDASWHAFSLLPVWRSMYSHTWCHSRCHVCPRSKKWANCLERVVVCPYVKTFIMSQFLHDPKDQIFIIDVMVINLTWAMVVLSVISWPIGVVTELNAIAKICKYRGFYEGHHFIMMAMEVHGTPRCDMDCFIIECVCLFHDRRLGIYLSLFFFCNQFSSNVLILLFNML